MKGKDSGILQSPKVKMLENRVQVESDKNVDSEEAVTVKEEVDIGYNYEFVNVILKEEEEEDIQENKFNDILSCDVGIIKESKHYCDQCEYVTGTPNQLKCHNENAHLGIRYECKDCEYAAATPNQLKIHIENAHLGIRYECKDCEYKATTPGNLKMHIQRKHLKLKYECNFCEHQTTSQQTLKEHQIANHTSDEEKQKYLKKCSMCDFTTLKARNLKQHIKYVHEGKMLTCDRDGCDFESTNKNSLQRHIRSVHEEGDTYKCDACEFETGRKDYFLRHKISIHGPDKYFCDQCEAGFKMESRLKS